MQLALGFSRLSKRGPQGIQPLERHLRAWLAVALEAVNLRFCGVHRPEKWAENSEF
jgi:hypothetical protein